MTILQCSAEQLLSTSRIAARLISTQLLSRGGASPFLTLSYPNPRRLKISAATVFRGDTPAAGLMSRLLSLCVVVAATPPNVVLFLADDLDVMLGGLTPLPQARALLQDQGTTMTNFFAHTPICCPSRAELLTGRYWHNLRVATHEDSGCMHIRSTGDNEASRCEGSPRGRH